MHHQAMVQEPKLPCAPRAAVKHGVFPISNRPCWEWQFATTCADSASAMPQGARNRTTASSLAAAFGAVGRVPHERTRPAKMDGKLCIGSLPGHLTADVGDRSAPTKSLRLR